MSRLSLLNELVKIADGEQNTQFNENVQSMDPQQQQQPNQAVQGAQQQMAATPQPQQPQQPQNDAVMTAQSFLGPDIMQAALGGDPNAQDLVAKTTAQIMQTVMAASGNGFNAGGQNPNEGMPQQQTQLSPEEDLANGIVPQSNPQPQPAAAPASQEKVSMLIRSLIGR